MMTEVARPSARSRYQRILRARERQEQALELEVAQVDQRLREFGAALERWRREESHTLDTLRQARRGADLELNARCLVYLKVVAAKIRAGEEEILRHQQAREELRKSLEDTMRSRKVLETYCDRLGRALRASREKTEQDAIDSYSDQKFLRDKGRP